LYRCTTKSKIHAFTVRSDDVLRQFRYSIDDIAHALMLMGRGASLYMAAAEVRHRAGRPESEDTNLTGSWLERFAPAILEKLLPNPAHLGTVLLDAVPFHVKALDSRGFPVEGGRMTFTVMGAAAQDRRGAPLLMLRLGASASKDIYAWRGFIRALPGDADRIICDGEQALMQNARLRWPNARLAVSVWHVLHRGEQILIKAERHSRKDPLYQALRRCMTSAATWRRFVRLARAAHLPALATWIDEGEAVIGPQLARRDRPTSTGALETALREVKKDLTLRRGSYREMRRLNLVLGLMTLHLNRVDRESEYARIIRVAN
jgi:hypothetical protein